VQRDLGQDVPPLGEHRIQSPPEPIVVEGGGVGSQQQLRPAGVSPRGHMHERLRRAEPIGHQGVDDFPDRDFPSHIRGAMPVNDLLDTHLPQQGVGQQQGTDVAYDELLCLLDLYG
jgi:hypothetical protein